MATTLVVDGYNAINAIPETRKRLKESLYAARKAIIMIAGEYARSSGYITAVQVVFDGDSRYRYMDAMDNTIGRTYIFSKTNCGDDTIIRTVRQHSRRGKVILASNDNYVRNNSRAYNASLIFVEELVRERKPRKTSRGISDKKIDRNVREEITREYKKELGL